MVFLSHTTFVPDIFLTGCFKILFAVSIPALRKKKTLLSPPHAHRKKTWRNRQKYYVVSCFRLEKKKVNE